MVLAVMLHSFPSWILFCIFLVKSFTISHHKVGVGGGQIGSQIYCFGVLCRNWGDWPVGLQFFLDWSVALDSFGLVLSWALCRNWWVWPIGLLIFFGNECSFGLFWFGVVLGSVLRGVIHWFTNHFLENSVALDCFG